MKKNNQNGKICNHNPNDANNTLIKLNKKIMTYPPTEFFLCDCCNMGFKFCLGEDGLYYEE